MIWYDTKNFVEITQSHSCTISRFFWSTVYVYKAQKKKWSFKTKHPEQKHVQALGRYYIVHTTQFNKTTAKNHPWFIVNIVSKVWTTKKNSKHPHLPVEEQQSNPTVLLSMQKNSNSAAQLDGNGLYYFKNSVGYNYM